MTVAGGCGDGEDLGESFGDPEKVVMNERTDKKGSSQKQHHSLLEILTSGADHFDGDCPSPLLSGLSTGFRSSCKQTGGSEEGTKESCFHTANFRNNIFFSKLAQPACETRDKASVSSLSSYKNAVGWAGRGGAFVGKRVC